MLLAYVGHAFDISFHLPSVHEISQLVHEKTLYVITLFIIVIYVVLHYAHTFWKPLHNIGDQKDGKVRKYRSGPDH